MTQILFGHFFMNEFPFQHLFIKMSSCWRPFHEKSVWKLFREKVFILMTFPNHFEYFFTNKSSFWRLVFEKVVILTTCSWKSRNVYDLFMKKSSLGGPEFVQVGSKTAQERPRCGHAGQIVVSLGDSQYFFRSRHSENPASSQQVANVWHTFMGRGP